jgi:ABC-type Zn2+ transport system substrate-binding protein/surface adhesin
MQIATDLRAGLSVMPIWMQSIVRELLSDQSSGGTDDGRSDHDHDDHDHDAGDDHPHALAD